MALLDIIQSARRQRHMLEIEYERPGQLPVKRLVEPYRIQSHNGELLLLGWYVVPQIADRLHWRNFRLDRIIYARDSTHEFEPRSAIQLDEPAPLSSDFRPDPALEPQRRYRAQLDVLLLDSRLTDDQFERAKAFQEGLAPEVIRGEHAQAFCRLIEEVLEDGRLNEQQANYLNPAADALARLGWSPGGAAAARPDVAAV